jgi:uncharacterized protein YjbI with pentapeptide repeats
MAPMRARLGRLVLLLFIGWAAAGCAGGSGPSTDPAVCGNGGHPSNLGKEFASLIAARKAPPKDLRCIDLSQAELTKANLRGVDLRGADLTQATLKGADLRGADLSHAKLIQADLDGARLDGADLSWADLTQADLTGASLTRANVWAARGVQASFGGIRTEGMKGQWPFYVLPGVVLVVSLFLGLREVSRIRATAGTPGVEPEFVNGIMQVPSARRPLLNIRGYLLVLVAALAYAAAALLVSSGIATVMLGLFTPLIGWHLGPLVLGETFGIFLYLPAGAGIAILGRNLTRRARRSPLS